MSVCVPAPPGEVTNRPNAVPAEIRHSLPGVTHSTTSCPAVYGSTPWRKLTPCVRPVIADPPEAS